MMRAIRERANEMDAVGMAATAIVLVAFLLLAMAYYDNRR